MYPIIYCAWELYNASGYCYELNKPYYRPCTVHYDVTVIDGSVNHCLCSAYTRTPPLIVHTHTILHIMSVITNARTMRWNLLCWWGCWQFTAETYRFNDSLGPVACVCTIHHALAVCVCIVWHAITTCVPWPHPHEHGSPGGRWTVAYVDI